MWIECNKGTNSLHVVYHIQLLLQLKNLGQYDRPRILGCKLVEGVLVVLSSNQLNISMFVHQMAEVWLPTMNKSGNIVLILAQVLFSEFW